MTAMSRRTCRSRMSDAGGVAPRRLVLREHEDSAPIWLSRTERDTLPVVHPGVQIQAASSRGDRYVLRPDQRVGVVALPTLVIEIQPKIPMPSALHLISVASDAIRWQPQVPDYDDDSSFTDLVAILLAKLVESATRRGLLHGYRPETEAAQAPRGRVLFEEFIRRRFGHAPPIDIEHDLYTPDVTENRLLLAALQALRKLSLRTKVARSKLADAQQALGGVSLVHFTPGSLPEYVPSTPLNSHYQPALTLALMVLRSSYLKLGAGMGRGTAFLVDMNLVFEKYLRNALRLALNLNERSFPARPPKTYLDRGSQVELRPDLTLIERGRIVWVGDAKYKILPDTKRINSDLYQLHAYATALGLPQATLVYGTGSEPVRHEHVAIGSGSRLQVQELNLNVSRNEIDRQVAELASRVRNPRSAHVAAAG